MLIQDIPDRAVENFWANVQKSEKEDGCWLWQGKTAKAGYPVTFLGDGRKTSARLFSYRLNIDETEAGSVQPCSQTKMCVNPHHLKANHSKASEITEQQVEQLRQQLNSWLVNHRKAFQRKVSMY